MNARLTFVTVNVFSFLTCCQKSTVMHWTQRASTAIFLFAPACKLLQFQLFLRVHQHLCHVRGAEKRSLWTLTAQVTDYSTKWLAITSIPGQYTDKVCTSCSVLMRKQGILCNIWRVLLAGTAAEAKPEMDRLRTEWPLLYVIGKQSVLCSIKENSAFFYFATADGPISAPSVHHADVGSLFMQDEYFRCIATPPVYTSTTLMDARTSQRTISRWPQIFVVSLFSLVVLWTIIVSSNDELMYLLHTETILNTGKFRCDRFNIDLIKRNHFHVV